MKENNICIEACPISNKVLGYVHDLRLHPTRALLRNGVKVSISSAYPGFFNNYGVTLDYLIAYLEWDLDLEDMYQLCVNSIDYSSISESRKKEIKVFFEYKW